MYMYMKWFLIFITILMVIAGAILVHLLQYDPIVIIIEVLFIGGSIVGVCYMCNILNILNRWQ